MSFSDLPSPLSPSFLFSTQRCNMKIKREIWELINGQIRPESWFDDEEDDPTIGELHAHVDADVDEDGMLDLKSLRIDDVDEANVNSWYVRLRSKDGSSFVVPREAAMCSGLLRRLLLDMLEPQKGEMATIALEQMSSKVLETAVQYMMYKLLTVGSQPPFTVDFAIITELLIASQFLDM